MTLAVTAMALCLEVVCLGTSDRVCCRLQAMSRVRAVGVGRSRSVETAKRKHLETMKNSMKMVMVMVCVGGIALECWAVWLAQLCVVAPMRNRFAVGDAAAQTLWRHRTWMKRS